MILTEQLVGIIPPELGKVVGIATYRGEYCLVACEYGLIKVWDDFMEVVEKKQLIDE